LRAFHRSTGAVLIGLCLFCLACSTPPIPPELSQAQRLDEDLRGIGVSFYAPADLGRFELGLKSAKTRIATERAKFGWFRDYGPAAADLRKILDEGEGLRRRIVSLKTSKTETFRARADALTARVAKIKRMTGFFNESAPVRMNLSQAEIKLAEADLLLKKEEYDAGSKNLAEGEFHIRAAEQAIADVLSRYRDGKEIAKWQTLARETIEESRQRGTVVILVSKLERKLTIYKSGAAIGSFDIGLGRYGLSDKLYSGDEATPEGKYRVAQKFPASDFYKALLINYPNDEDRKTFADARRKGLVPGQAGIGGAIEIHGGGKDSLTKGCVGLENKDMDRVYDYARVGTVVTIVGLMSVENTILAEIEKFDVHD
jgi:L,D-peptidoglycan transpeptidase YkuD (ErfK/YbiS/YcfS/YnhG family)